MVKLSSDMFADHSKAVILLWIFLLYMFHVYTLVSVSCSLVPAGKGLNFGSLVCCVFLCLCHFSIWCSGSGKVLGCIDS